MWDTAQRVAARYLAANAAMPPLDGKTRQQVVRLVSGVIEKARLGGVFRDANWEPINRLWHTLDAAGIPVVRGKSYYGKDDRGTPASKTWEFTVEWAGPNGKPLTAYGRVIASGAGSVDEPLDTYDVVAYVS